MNKTTYCIALAATLAAFALTVQTAANAAPTIYTDSATFNAALTSSFFDPLNGVPTGNFIYSASGNGFGVAVTTSGGMIYSNGSFIAGNNVNTALIFTFTGAPVNAIGGNFFAANTSDNFVSDVVSISFSDGSTDSYTPTGFSTYRGYVFAAPITSVTLNGYTAGSARFASLDNLTIGSAVAVVVPESSTLALLGVGCSLLGVAVLRRRG